MSIKKTLGLCGVIALAIIFIFVYIGGYMKNNEVPWDTKVEIGIKATNSDRVLKINTLACHLTDEYFKSGIKRRVYIQYPYLTFTGNINQVYYCPDKQDGNINNLIVESAPIGGYKNLKGQFNADKYLKNLATIVPNTELLGEKNNIQIYGTPARIKIILKGLSDTSHVLTIEHSRIHRGDTSSSFLYYYDITTMISNNFMATYAVIATDKNEVVLGGKNFMPFPVDAEFAREFHHVLITEGELGILDHPEIIQKFIDNNEKIVHYIKSISTEYSDPDAQSYIKLLSDD